MDSAFNELKSFGDRVIVNDTISALWIESLLISELEKSILHTYFYEVASTDDIAMRIDISKSTEDDVIATIHLENDAKERLLQCFSLYRYSTYYWDSFEGYEGMSPWSQFVDALISQGCVEGHFTGSGIDVSCSGAAYFIGSLGSALADF